jgi:hypothetical protein
LSEGVLGDWIDANVDSVAVASRSAESRTTETYVENARFSRTRRAASVADSTADSAAFAELRAFNRYAVGVRAEPAQLDATTARRTTHPTRRRHTTSPQYPNGYASTPATRVAGATVSRIGLAGTERRMPGTRSNVENAKH